MSHKIITEWRGSRPASYRKQYPWQDIEATHNPNDRQGYYIEGPDNAYDAAEMIARDYNLYDQPIEVQAWGHDEWHGKSCGVFFVRRPEPEVKPKGKRKS